MSYLWHIWGRETVRGVAIRLAMMNAASRAEAEHRARLCYVSPILHVIADLSWQAMSPRDQQAFIGEPVQKKPVRVQDVGDVRRIVCRVCGEEIIYTRDANGQWPKTYRAYHDGKCRLQYNEEQRAYRKRYRAEVKARRIHDHPDPAVADRASATQSQTPDPSL